jgi:hypothetical protein
MTARMFSKNRPRNLKILNISGFPFISYLFRFKGVIMMKSNGKIINLIRNYDDLTDEGKNELLLVGEKYLREKDLPAKERSENKNEDFGAVPKVTGFLNWSE